MLLPLQENATRSPQAASAEAARAASPAAAEQEAAAGAAAGVEITRVQPPVHGPNTVVFRRGAGSPTSLYEAATAHREELGEQLQRLQERRSSIASRLRGEEEIKGADRAGLETRLSAIDARILELDKAIEAADVQVAQAAGVPGAVAGLRERERLQRQREEAMGPPEEVFVLGGIFIVVVCFPLAVAHARRIWRRGAAAVTALPGDLMERMSRLEQGVESIAIEVERIGEGQRFMTRVFTDTNSGRALGGSPAEPIRQPSRDPVSARTSDSR